MVLPKNGPEGKSDFFLGNFPGNFDPERFSGGAFDYFFRGISSGLVNFRDFDFFKFELPRDKTESIQEQISGFDKNSE
jgi:hypothetical protein